MNAPAHSLYEKLKRFHSHTSAGTPENPSSEPSSSEPNEASTPSRIPDQLLNIPGVVKASKLNGIRKQRESEKERFLQSVGFDIGENRWGRYAFRDTRYPAKQMNCNLSDITGRELVIQSKDERFAALHAEDILFIDTETTGLAGGTGTVPFLIGAGSFERAEFIVRQYFMRDYPDEPAVLQALEEQLGGYGAISGFNSKGFDVPLLQSRFILNQISTRISDLPHLDLLYPARRFWRNGLPDCRLGTIEEWILGHKRSGDIPSELIPSVYFDFVRGQRIHRMKPVLHHNNEDIAILAAMAARICRMLLSPRSECLSPGECAGAAACLDAFGMTRAAMDCLDRALSMLSHPHEHTGETDYRIRKQLALLLRRENQISKAVEQWRIMAQKHAALYPRIELAKYYEHTIKDYPQALQYTESALALLASNGGVSQNGISLNDIHHRRNRLQRKLNSRD